MAIAVRRWRRRAEAADFGQQTASATRWRVSALPSEALPVPGVGRGRWLLELIRCRAGESADFIGDACDAQGRLDLPADRADRSHDARMGSGAPDHTKPPVLIGQHGRQRVVTAVNPVRAGLGLRSDMPATKARALVPDLVVQHADPDADAKALDRLAVWALRYSPIVAVDVPDRIVLDTAGADHLHGGEKSMAFDVGRRLRQAALEARVAISGAWGASHRLARFLRRSGDDRPGRCGERRKPGMNNVINGTPAARRM